MKLDKELYTLKEVAELFEVTLPTVYDWMNRRGLAWVQLGARRRITRQAIIDFLKPGGDAGTAEQYNTQDIRTPGHAEPLLEAA